MTKIALPPEGIRQLRPPRTPCENRVRREKSAPDTMRTENFGYLTERA
ncbi:hypothetical protein ACRB68_13880 [Actinomadura sp. RB68]|uniref:Uncharacterized protein n=1 Tax=Actinomadura macrotermitis TaxID=2585200 RepID=A0A7K0BQN4_9ACTN|nr:hypothetical protein [Actinomadura macrotermitis]